MEISNFDEDFLGLENFASKLEGFIKVEQNFVSGSLVLSLTSPFGTGKSTFLKMWRNRLEHEYEENQNEKVNKKNEKEDVGKKNILAVEVNAWNDDYCGEPLIALISEIMEALQKNTKNGNLDKIKRAVKDIGWFAVGIGGQVVKKFTGADVVAAGKLAEEKHDDRECTTIDVFETFKARKKALKNLKEAISAFVEELDLNLFIFVDELDRCRPDYTISYLETIKHVFDIKGVSFVLAIDRNQLECSAKATFGGDLNFPEYFRKFVHREIGLPEFNEKGYRSIVRNYIEYYLKDSQKSERYCSLNISERFDDLVTLMCSMELTFRQTQEAFRVMGHAFETSKGREGGLAWCLGVGTVLMVTLKINGNAIYHEIGKNGLGIKKVKT